MPQHRSAKKNVRKSGRRRLINRNRKGILKAKIKDVLSAVEAKDTARAKEAFFKSVSIIDKMAGKGIIHKNNAARKKSKLWHKINSLNINDNS